MKPAAFVLGLIVLALPPWARAEESLVARREVCRQEARARIGRKEKVDVEGYRRIVERRNAHVDQCMTRVRVFVARKEAPLPPQRALTVTMSERAESQISLAPKRSTKLAKGKERKKLQVALARASKGQGLKRRTLRRLSRSK